MLAILLVLSSAFLSVFAKEVTIFGVIGTQTETPVPTPSISLSPVGTGSDGIATYDAFLSFDNVVQTFLDDRISPISIPARTYHATYLAASTQLVISGVGEGLEIGASYTSTYDAFQTEVEACSWGEERVQGTCVLAVNGEPMLTYTGTVGPVFTVTVDNAATPIQTPRHKWMATLLLLTSGFMLGIVRLFI
ncbi:hypothetical protein ONZ45_g15324 [Pleurotus djamor]|nr:hypothetical protein ONZ45_g15324 [Pleurotus djamor]